jgi:hypothetical protein
MPEVEVAREKGSREELFAEFFQLWGIEENECANGTEEQNDEEGRKDPTHPALIKGNNRKPPGLQILEQQRSDEITGNDVKDIDPDEAVSEVSETKVIEDHHENGNGTKAINVRAILGGVACHRFEGDSCARPHQSQPFLDGCHGCVV